MLEAVHNKIEDLNRIFRFHRLFGSGTEFADVLDTKRFVASPIEQPDPLLISARFGGAITYGIPTTFECIDNPYFLLLYIEKGDVLIKAKESLKLREKNMILIGPGEKFRFDTSSTPCYFHMFLLSGDSLGLYINKSFEIIEFTEKYVESQLAYLQRLLQRPGLDIEFMRAKLLTDILTDAYLAGSKASAPSAPSGIPGHVQEMKNILDREYNSSITLGSLEKRLFVSKYRLCREFSSYYGRSPLQYLNSLRIQKAKALLEQTDISIHSIGYDVGISNTSHFIKLFKRETSKTPAQYRKSKSS
ncbi:AraC family transcriptional regulator [Butyrivibrio sp. WCD3002]|uniref:AraC family transcriptional regulator n=1 Tax=Butyrivibrio sp. WCD3002 TaxID=1280676 RepID=UPI0004015740|nr:AraC family transcriptional regulator [Butyrivibrio sp. WCD3002]